MASLRPLLENKTSCLSGGSVKARKRFDIGYWLPMRGLKAHDLSPTLDRELACLTAYRFNSSFPYRKTVRWKFLF